MQLRYIVPLLLYVIVSTPTHSHARSARVNQIPNGNQFSCGNCHVNPSGGGSRNAFGQAIESGFLNGSGGGATVDWGPSLAVLDSDGDGVSNGLELGDPNGDGTPDAGATVTNPGDPTSVPNRAPVLVSIGAKNVLEGETLTFSVTASDQDGDGVTITASGLPTGATFSGNTFTWTPGLEDGGETVTVSFVATDGQLNGSRSVSISVENVNRAPAIAALDPQTVLEGEVVSFVVAATDEDGDALTITSSDLPAGATLSGDTFTWTPGFDQGGQTVTVTFVATDGDLDATRSVDIAIEDVNQPARIDAFTPSDNLIVSSEGMSLSFSVDAVDPENETLSFEWTLNGISVESMTNSFDLDVLGMSDDVVVVTVSSDDGSSVTQSWTVAHSLKGDFDGNGSVDFGDFLGFAGAFGNTSASPEWDPVFDLSGDDRVDFTDFLTFAQFFGLSG